MSLRKKIFFYLFIFLVFVVFVAGYFLLCTPWLLEKGIPLWINKQDSSVHVEEVLVGRQQFVWPEKLILTDLSTRLKFNNDLGKLSIGSLQLRDLTGLWQADGIWKLMAKKINLAFSDLVIKKATIALRKSDRDDRDRQRVFEGKIQVSELKINEYQLTNIISFITGTKKQVVFKDIKADFYGGTIAGAASVDDFSSLEYHLALDLNGVDLKQMEKVVASLSQQVSGFISATVNAEGAGNEIKRFDVDLSLAEGGKIKAFLLQPLIEYIPQSIQKREIEALISRGGDISLDHAKLLIRNVSRRQLTIEVILQSNEYNLNIDLTIGINLDEDINELFPALSLGGVNE